MGWGRAAPVGGWLARKFRMPPGWLLSSHAHHGRFAVVEPFCTLGDNNILWSGSTVCHGTRMGSHNFLAAGVVVGGECRIGDRCFFGFSSTVREKVSVADETLLGAQSLLLQDTAPFGAYLGVPARRRGEHEAEGLRIGR